MLHLSSESLTLLQSRDVAAASSAGRCSGRREIAMKCLSPSVPFLPTSTGVFKAQSVSLSLSLNRHSRVIHAAASSSAGLQTSEPVAGGGDNDQSSGGGGSGGGGGGGGGEGGAGGADNEGSDSAKNKAEALAALAALGRSVEWLPADLADAVLAGRIPAIIVERFAALQSSPIFRFLMQSGGFKERLLADDLFLTKVAIECGVGIFTKVWTMC